MDDQFAINSDNLYDSLQKNEQLLVFDLRLQETYESGHIKGSVHAVCDVNTKETIMPKIPKNVKIVLVDDDGKMAAETSTMMRSFGLDAYFLHGGMKQWSKETVKGNPPSSIKPDELWKKLQSQNVFLLDVRDADEFSDFQIPKSVNIPLKDVFKSENISKIPKDKEIITICPHGNRAMVATFALARNGVKSHVLEGGLAGWSQVLTATIAAENPTVIQVEKIGKGCLSHVIVSEKDAIVIDPLFPVEKYAEIAKQQGVKITKILDTHQHADHLSAAWNLTELTDAVLYESNLEQWDRNEAALLDDKQEIEFGESKLRVIHTPGHTSGSLCYVIDEKYVFTGDILFVESIGRPDLRDQAEEFAKYLFDSLHNKLLKLKPDTIVFPTHHGQSVTPTNGIYSTTIEKAKQHDILKLSQEEFVKQVVGVTISRPMNYQKIIQINKGSIPLVATEIPDLELGPNRCSIAGP